MKKNFVRVAFLWSVLSSLILLPTTSFAIDLFNTSTGVLIIPEVDVNGDTFYDNVTLKLDFRTGTFELLSADVKPNNISITPLDTLTESDIKMDFMGCTRSGRNKATCHIKLTSLGGFDRSIRVYANHGTQTLLFDDLGNTYAASKVSVGNFESGSSVVLTLVAGIPTLAKYEFINISPNASSLSLLQPAFQSTTTFFGDFRNINF